MADERGSGKHSLCEPPPHAVARAAVKSSGSSGSWGAGVGLCAGGDECSGAQPSGNCLPGRHHHTQLSPSAASCTPGHLSQRKESVHTGSCTREFVLALFIVAPN